MLAPYYHTQTKFVPGSFRIVQVRSSEVPQLRTEKQDPLDKVVPLTEEADSTVNNLRVLVGEIPAVSASFGSKGPVRMT